MHWCDPSQAPTGIWTRVPSMRGGWLTNWAIPPTWSMVTWSRNLTTNWTSRLCNKLPVHEHAPKICYKTDLWRTFNCAKIEWNVFWRLHKNAIFMYICSPYVFLVYTQNYLIMLIFEMNVIFILIPKLLGTIYSIYWINSKLWNSMLVDIKRSPKGF